MSELNNIFGCTANYWLRFCPELCFLKTVIAPTSSAKDNFFHLNELTPTNFRTTGSDEGQLS